MMHFLHLALLSCMLIVFSANPALEFSSSSPAKGITSNKVEPVATNLLYQSKDGGQTWEDVSHSLPDNEQLEGFFVGTSELYLRINNKMYQSESNLNVPRWEKVQGLDPLTNFIAFNRSGVMAYNYEGNVYQKKSSAESWMPVYANFKKSSMRTIFETTDGTLFLGRDSGLYKSTDKGRNWKRVQDEGWVIDLVESNGVIIGTGMKGIMRSTDNGEHWEWVISEGGVGIAVERIEGGFAAISFNTSTQSRRVRISLDSGKTWQAIDEGLQPSLSISSIKQVGKYLICGHPEGIFRSSDMGKTWQMVHAGVEQAKIKIPNMLNINPISDGRKAFSIYVSGNILYAVAKEGGC